MNQKIKDMIRGVLFAVGTWMIVLPTRDYLIDALPIKNSFVIGIIILIIVFIFWET